MFEIPLVSVIVPVYNVEQYLERCVNSILEQTYRNLEIFLVDDGSTDNSGYLCDDFEKKDNRIKVIHKKNGGLSDARNVALDSISGKWVTFIDSDDWIDENYISHLLELAMSNDCDISIATYMDVVEDSEQKRKRKSGYIKMMDSMQALENLLYQRYFTTAAWCKLFKTDLFSEIRFPTGKLYEDVETIYRVFCKSKYLVYSSEVLYYYFQRQSSIVRDKFSLRKLDYVDNTKIVLHDVKNKYPDLVDAAISRVLWADIHVLVHMDNIQLYKETYAMLWKDIKTYRMNVLFDKKVKITNKIVILLTFGGHKFIRSIFKLSKQIH